MCVLQLMSGLPLPCPFGELFLSGLGVLGVNADVTCPHGWEGRASGARRRSQVPPTLSHSQYRSPTPYSEALE